MSTRKKEGISSVREKTSKGSSPSLSPSHLKSSPKKPSKTVSTSRSLDSSPSDKKSIPNYLKPTLSSSGDPTKIHPRKPVSNTDSTLKSNLTRRRSFDKPPSPTCTLKARGDSPTTAFRSSSFSGKTGDGKATSTTTTTTSPKGDRSLRGKQHSPLYSRSISTLKKGASGKSKSKQGETRTGSSSRKEAKHDDCNVVDVSDHESSVVESEQVHKEHEEEREQEEPVVGNQEIDMSTDEQIHGVIDEVETNHEQIEDEVHKADSPAASDHDHDHDHDGGDDDDGKVESPTILEDREANVETGETREDGNVSEVDSPTLSEQDKVESPAAASEKQEAVNEEADDAAMDESLEDSESPKVESRHEGEISPAASDRSCIEEVISIQEQETKEKHEDGGETSNPDERVGDDPNGETEEADESKAEADQNGAEEARAHEADEEKHGVVEEDENAAPKVAHGKKNVALSNNVIEEMTREQRRNKVRALAGAFETVMQRQEPK